MSELGEQYQRVSDEVFYSTQPILTVTSELISKMKLMADRNPSGKVRICAHPRPEDPLHEMLLVLKRTVRFKHHLHLKKSESFHVIEGRLNVEIFDAEGSLTRTIEMGDYSSGLAFFYRLNAERFHTVTPVSDYVVYHETTQGPFDPEQTLYLGDQ